MCPRSRKALSERKLGWKDPVVSPDATTNLGQPRRPSVTSETAFSTTSAPGKLAVATAAANGHGRLLTGVARCDAPSDPQTGITTQDGAVSAAGVPAISGVVGTVGHGAEMQGELAALTPRPFCPVCKLVCWPHTLVEC